MTYDQLYKFITEKMQMQAVYQPVMLMQLLKNGGIADESVIAQAILDLDPTQIAYYKDRVRNMVGQVLRKHGVTTRNDSVHRLTAYENLSPEQVSSLINLLQEKLDAELLSRGEQFWKHRATEREQIGSIRYKVLERALGRCECCGISKEDRPLDVDHIVPRSKKGKNDISNYQALCWLCNTNKGNRSAFDFRGLDTKYEQREKNCLFCDLQTDDRERIVEENTLAYVVRDAYPVTKHHTLIIPKRHTLDFFGLTQAELNAINALLHSQKKVIEKADSSVEGFNVGMNCGEIAGQSVWHCHVHLIPRRKGDVQHPKGGVRNIIAGKGDYSGNPLRIEELTEAPPNRSEIHLLKEYCRTNQRVCPLPHYWHEMYVIIAGHGKSNLPLPLILAAWGLSDEEKSARFMLHLDYSVSNGTLTQVDEYLRGLSDDQWYCG